MSGTSIGIAALFCYSRALSSDLRNFFTSTWNVLVAVFDLDRLSPLTLKLSLSSLFQCFYFSDFTVQEAVKHSVRRPSDTFEQRESVQKLGITVRQDF